MAGGAVLSPLFLSLLDFLKSTDLLSHVRDGRVLDEFKWETLLMTIFAKMLKEHVIIVFVYLFANIVAHQINRHL